MSEAIRSPIYHWVFWQDVPVAYIPTQKITYYDYMKDVIYTGDCQDKDFETCKKDSAVSFKSYFDKNNNKIDLYTKNKNNKNYKIKIYAYDKNGKKLEKWNIDWNNFSEGNITKYLYDKSNLLTSEFVREYKDKKYYNDKTKKDTVKTEITKTYTKYIYDNKGNIISKKLKCNEKLENCKSQIKYEYDTKGNLIKETADNYTYIYDINGNIIQKYNKTKYSDYYYKYDYDKCNNILKEYKCNDNWSNCQESIQYKYNYMQ
ncbi:MAG: hypothetical protein MJ180_00785 [Candidatus Gastranaerophilales bacterium]|nr:hypothetical protein [Candidatus Gastranaerophilales bacterium]